MMRSCNLCILLIVLLLSFVAGCQKNDATDSDGVNVKVEQLKAYETLPANENLLLGLPVGVKYDDESQHLFIQDIGRTQIIEIDDSSTIVNTFGGEGRGPGEVQALIDFFITEEHLFILDTSQLLINKYSRRNGQYLSSFDYGPYQLKRKTTSEGNPPPPPKPPFIDSNNLPFVTQNETVLLPTHTGGEYLYQAINWKGEKLADIGEIPTGYTARQDNDEIRSALENKEVPVRDSTLAFPVNDRANSDEIFLMYSAVPKITKYNLSGEKIWEQKIPETPEVDSLMVDLSEVVSSRPNMLIPVRKYVTGRSGPDGGLYLFTYTNTQLPPYRRPLWMHQFDPQGNLISRHKITSEVDLSYFADIDFRRNRIIIPEFMDTGIRIYPF